MEFSDIVIYIAIPYRHPSPAIMQHRLDVVKHAVRCFSQKGIATYCPVLQFHTIADDLPKDDKFWDSLCSKLLRTCDELYVLTAEGWESSRGIQSEIEYAEEFNMPITMIDPDSLCL